MANFTLNFVDTISMAEVFGEIPDLQPHEVFIDTIALGEVFSVSLQDNPNVDFVDDQIILSDDFSFRKAVFTELNFEDIVQLTEVYNNVSNNRVELNFEDIVSITDDYDQRNSLRIFKTFEDSLLITDVLVVLYELRVINGTINGLSNDSLATGEVGGLVATTPTGYSFSHWSWDGPTFKTGIDNVYAGTTDITMPSGGGVVVANFIQIDSEIDNTVIVYDPADLKYIDNFSGADYINTEITSTYAGGKMGVANHDFEILQGALFNQIIVYRDTNSGPIDLTGYTAEMQIRAYKDAPDPALLTLNTSNGYLTLGGTAGTITIAVNGVITDALDFDWGYYDLELYPAGDVDNTIRVLEGRIELSKQITR